MDIFYDLHGKTKARSRNFAAGFLFSDILCRIFAFAEIQSAADSF